MKTGGWNTFWIVIGAIATVIARPFQKKQKFGPPTQCPYCPNPARPETEAYRENGCAWKYLNKNPTGADPPCVSDGWLEEIGYR